MRTGRTLDVMKRVMQHEVLLISRSSYVEVLAMPAYSDKVRGPFVVAIWHQVCENELHKVVVQICLRRCLGISTMVADGYMFARNGFRRLEKNEIWEFC